MLQSEVFHESNEKFSEAVVNNEGLLSHYLKNLHMVLGGLLGLTITIKIITMTYETDINMEDVLDNVFFKYIKQQRGTSSITGSNPNLFNDDIMT